MDDQEKRADAVVVSTSQKCEENEATSRHADFWMSTYGFSSVHHDVMYALLPLRIRCRIGFVSGEV